MGDRTSVTLTVPAEYRDLVESFDDTYDNDFAGGGTTHSFLYYEVNYGELDFLNELESRGIAYDSAWGSGDNYGSGIKSCRFSPEGIIDIKEIYDNARNPNIQQLMYLIESPDELIKFIQIYHENISVLPWDNQVEYGKHYLARKLIEPNT